MKNRALVVVDMQNDFITGALGSAEARSIVPGVADLIRGFDGYVFATMDTHGEDYRDVVEGSLIPAHCYANTEGWEMPKEIAGALDECGAQIVEKGAFGSLELMELLGKRRGGFEEIVLCGLCTDICVVSNALMLRAAFPKADICVLADCCAGSSPKLHEEALDIMRSCCIAVK